MSTSIARYVRRAIGAPIKRTDTIVHQADSKTKHGKRIAKTVGLESTRISPSRRIARHAAPGNTTVRIKELPKVSAKSVLRGATAQPETGMTVRPAHSKTKDTGRNAKIAAMECIKIRRHNLVAARVPRGGTTL
jgi:hypothetical protein